MSEENSSDEPLLPHQSPEPKRPIVVQREVQDNEVDYGDNEDDQGDQETEEPFGEPDYSSYSDWNEDVKPKSKTMAAKKKHIPALVLVENPWSIPNDYDESWSEQNWKNNEKVGCLHLLVQKK